METRRYGMLSADVCRLTGVAEPRISVASLDGGDVRSLCTSMTRQSMRRWPPFGGKSSGAGGQFGGKASLDTFSDVQWITVQAQIERYSS